MKFENQYIIPFKGLKEGIHDFSLNITGQFFEDYEKLDVRDGNVAVQVELEKKSSFMNLAVELKGEIEVRCDRCLEYFNMPLFYSGHLVVKLSETENESDDEVIFIHPDESLLDLKHYLYECIFLTIPIRKVHPDLPDGTPGCDKEMLKRLKEHLIE